MQKGLLSLVIFLFPLFFLPTTQEFFLTNKLYLLMIAIIALVVLSAFRLLITNHIHIQWGSINAYILAFLLLIGASVLFSSPNKVQALLQVNMGLGLVVCLVLLYWYASTLSIKPLSILFYSAFVLSAITIVCFFNPFGAMQLPQQLQFLGSQYFSPLGSQLDLAIFLGYFAITSVAALAILFLKKENKPNLISIFFAVVISIGFITSCILVYKQLHTNQTPSASFQLELPPIRNSYLSAIETLKNPRTALFGFGIDNFSTAFTQSKPANYNLSRQWDRNFRFSRSGLLHIFSEAGLPAMLIFILICAFAFLSLKKSRNAQLPDNVDMAEHESDRQIVTVGLLYVIIALLLFPISSPLLFLFFLSLAHVSKLEGKHAHKSFSLGTMRPLGIVGVLALFILIGLSSYGIAQAYAAEYNFKKAINYLGANDGKNVYIYHRLAITHNPYIERYRINFSQLNLLIANNIARNSKKPTSQERQTIAQAIQIAIQEAKAAVTLNPQRSANWENLGAIYRNIINVAQNANVWTISSYQRAISLDPNNPLLRIALGGVYYGFGSYDDAATLFSQGVALKPDFANFRYNLAWAYFQNKRYDKAVVEMQNTLSLLSNKSSSDYKKALTELAKFKKSLPSKPISTPSANLKNTSATTPQSPLTLPETPISSMSPKINLPLGVEPPIASPTASTR